ncbi:hypothetical protein ACVWZ3_008054 [Bradyrhizobium sp. i1.3.6]
MRRYTPTIGVWARTSSFDIPTGSPTCDARLPVAAFLERGAAGDIEITPEERRAVHEIIHSIFELYELKVHGFFPPAIWKIREPDIERLLSLPVFQQELAGLEGRYTRHPRLTAWLEKIRGQRETA